MNGRYALSLPVDLKREAERAAKEQGVSLNQFILWSLADKVAQLRNSLSPSAFPSITIIKSASGQLVPVVNNGVRVQTIVIASQVWGESPQNIAEQYGLPKKVVEETLKYYEANKRYVDMLIEENDRP
jgi:uncharacterized protein (DUF433 family)